MIKLNYILPTGGYIKSDPEPALVNGEARLDEDWYFHWLNHMIAENPDVNFFFTVASTDVWDEIDDVASEAALKRLRKKLTGD